MIQLPNNINSIQTYKPGKPSDDIFGKDIQPVFLSSNENNFGPSPKAVAAIVQNVQSLHLYPDPTSHKLRTALSDYLGVAIENILPANGSDEILAMMFDAFFNEGEHILTSENTFVSVKVNAAIKNVEYRSVPMTEDYRFDLDAILSRIDEKTKVVYLCNPNNPTGQGIKKEELKSFIDQVPPSIIVVIDEAYFETAIHIDSDFPDSTSLKAANVITLRTFSKVFGLAGLRLGYAVGPAYLLNALMKARQVFSPTRLAQVGGEAALEDADYIQKTLNNNTAEMAKYVAVFNELGVKHITSFANFIMLDLGSEQKVEETFAGLMAKGVLTRRLASFGLPHCLRISIGTPQENARCIEAFKAL